MGRLLLQALCAASALTFSASKATMGLTNLWPDSFFLNPTDSSSHGAAKGAGGPVAHHESGHDSMEHEAESDAVAVALALMLLGTVGWVMSMFYFVNFPDDDIQKATWNVLSEMVSIFCAVVLFSATQAVLIDFAGMTDPALRHATPNLKSMVMSLVRVVGIHAFVQFLLHRYKSDHFTLRYCAGLGGHVVGFALIDFFGKMLTLNFFKQNLFMAFLGLIISVVGIIAIHHPIAQYRASLQCEDADAHWKELANESEMESLGLAMGLLLSMVLRMCITGRMPPVHGAPLHKTSGEVAALFTVALLFAPAVMGVNVYRHRYVHAGDNFVKKRVLESLQEVCSMSMGWCLLYWGYWLFYLRVGDQGLGHGGKMSQRVVMALLFSTFVFVAIIILDFLADRAGPAANKGLRALLKTLALLMGLSWEATFSEAVEAIADSYEGHLRTIMNIGLTLLLCVVVLPAWVFYILPNADNTWGCEEGLEHDEKEVETGGHGAHKSKQVKA